MRYRDGKSRHIVDDGCEESRVLVCDQQADIHKDGQKHRELRVLLSRRKPAAEIV